MAKGVGPGIRLSELFPPLSALCPEAGYLTSLDLSVLLCTMGVVLLLTSQNCYEDQINSYKAVEMVFCI